MDIISHFKIVNYSLYIDNLKTLVIGDLHIGYEESLNNNGVLIPHFQLNDMKKEIDKISNLTVKRIIFLGDIKHEFSKISRQEWKEISFFFSYINLKFKNPEIIVIKGNHDNFLEPILKKISIDLVDNLLLDNTFFLHGDKLFNIPKDVQTIIIGHEHPAILITDGKRQEKFKCFLKGKYKKRDLIVLPSFFNITYGTDVLKEKIISPFIKKIKNFEVYVVADKTYYFGYIRDL